MALDALQNGRYRRLRLLGSGGMGEVYLMQDERVNRQVAIKVIRSENTPYPDSPAAADAARLFQREAKAIAALEHPNILPLYDFGEEISDGVTLSYMVMPFCADGSLATWLRQNGGNQLSVQDVAQLIEQAADALQYAHDHDMIHLDVKPPNFLLRSNKKNPKRPVLLLADFGIARSSSTVSNSSRTIRGTPTSMAPEQWSSQPVPATDQYALAVMAYEMLTARPPFAGSMEQLMYQHFSATPPAPSAFNSTLSAAVDRVLLRALAKKPEERFPSIADFATAFVEAARQSGQEPPLFDSSVYATLAISKEEANTGISRMITLPGGKQIAVPVPAGVQDGQVIHLPHTVDTLNQSGAGDVVLTIAIKQTGESQATQASQSGQASQAVKDGKDENKPDTADSASPRDARDARDTPVLLRGQSNAALTLPPVSDANVPSPARVSEHNLPTMAVSQGSQGAGPIAGQLQTTPATAPTRGGTRWGIIAIISLLVVLLLVVSSLFYFNVLSNSHKTGTTTQSSSTTPVVAQKPTPTPTTGITPTPTPTPPDGLYIPGTYKGSMLNETTQQTTYLTVFLVETKGNGTLNGSVTYTSAPQGVYILHGTVDMQGNFGFSFTPSGQSQPLHMYGTVLRQGDGNYLKGNFCNSTTTTCLSNDGYFNVGPGY